MLLELTRFVSRVLQRWRRPDRQPEDEPSEPTSEHEPPAEVVATPPVAVENLSAHRRKPNRHKNPEPEPLDGDAGIQRPRRCRLRPEARLKHAPGTTAQLR